MRAGASHLMFYPRRLAKSEFVALRDAWTIDALYVRTRCRLSPLVSLTEDSDRGSIKSSKVKVDDISAQDTWSNVSELSSEGHNIGQALPTE